MTYQILSFLDPLLKRNNREDDINQNSSCLKFILVNSTVGNNK